MKVDARAAIQVYSIAWRLVQTFDHKTYEEWQY